MQQCIEKDRSGDYGDLMVGNGTSTGKGGVLRGHLDEIRRGRKTKDGQEVLPYNKIWRGRGRRDKGLNSNTINIISPSSGYAERCDFCAGADMAGCRSPQPYVD